jgi:hypothetical protein
MKWRIMGRYFSSAKDEPRLSSSRLPEWAAIFFVLLAVAALSGCGKPEANISAMSPALISGQWISGGRPARIEADGDGLACINENESKSRAEIKDGKVLVAIDWHTSATLSPNGKELRWDNDTIWVR